MIVVKTANNKSSKICSQFANDERPATSDYFSIGSALILTVVLTTLLATIGVLFVLLSRIDKMAASAASENREINSAVETVIAKIKQELVSDVPGVAGEYYDYPGLEDRWLASLEPCQVAANNYRWPQISDVYNKLGPNLWLQAAIVPDYQDAKIMGEGQIADADGDGVADSRWVVIPDVNSGKGRPIYAAIRIIDNGGMLNVNTDFKFNPADPCFSSIDYIDGHSQLQINLMALAGRPPLPSWPVGIPYTPQEEILLLSERDRCGIGAGLNDYENFVIWSYGELARPYTPFDISDELELRYRFLLNHEDIDTRLEEWGGEFRSTILSTPVTSGGQELDTWFKRAHFDPNILNLNDPKDPNYYAYRHIATTCNMDRIIDPCGIRMANVNRDNVGKLYSAIYAGLCDANFAGNRVETASQLAVNLIDYRDSDDYVTSFAAPDGKIYYGFERPCIYISELDYNSVTTGSPPTPHTTYAVELYKPYSEDSVPRLNRPDSWQLVVGSASIAIDPSPSWLPGKSFCVIRNQDPNATITMDPNAVVQNSVDVIFSSNRKIELQRKVTDPNGASKYIAVDTIWVPSWLVTGQGLRSYQRDITKHKCIRRLWDPSNPSTRTPTLGSINSYVDNSRPQLIQARPANRLFTNIGEIGTIFQMSVYSQGPNPIKPTDNEFTARLNLINPAFQQIFNYLTVIDPAGHGQPSSETRIKGRINVNTAPWFVIAQLPWMQSSIARAIVGYRDTAAKGFRSIGELMDVAEMDYYGNQNLQPGNLTGFPDLTPNDGAADDFEERDVIFARISNLVTVRSDVFTAYILVRIGANGPQRRVIAILDRSKVTSPTDKVKIIAIQPVPDPR
jgi:DNA uptake protein ComE-like DNA-binding protein